MDQIKIGKFISLKRKEKNITQNELAEMLNITNRAISKWENGICLPDVGTMPILCKILDITINDLFSGEVVDMKDNVYLFKFMEETVYAEVMHIISAIFGFLVVIVNLKLWLIVGIPLAIFNFILQILPVMVQRYNRPKLMLAYKRNEKYNHSISK